MPALRGVAAAVVLLTAVCAQATATAAPPPPVVKVFTFTGAEQTFDVPAGVTTLDVVAVGANGGGGFSVSGYTAGGIGGVRSGTIPVAPGTRLYVEVGGVGTTPAWGEEASGGFNGGGFGHWALSSLMSGGGGGGASDVRASRRGTAASADSRLIVAGGGGGGGGGFGAFGGPGGDADAAGGSVASASGGAVGAGGAENGSDGGSWPSGGGGGGGGGGVSGGGGGQGGDPAGGGGAGGSSGFAAPVTNRGATGAVAGEAPKVIVTYLVPTADLSADSLTFAEPQLQGTLGPSRTIAMRNAGEVPLVVSGFTITGANPDDFVLSATDCLSGVAPLGTCQISVRFAPSRSGARSAVLHVATSAGEREVALAGSGAEPARQAAATPSPAGAGDLVVVGYQARVAARRVTIRYALTAPADVTLTTVRRSGRSVVLAKTRGRSGLNRIVVDRKRAGKPDRRGVYRFTLTATRDGRSASSAITVRTR